MIPLTDAQQHILDLLRRNAPSWAIASARDEVMQQWARRRALRRAKDKTLGGWQRLLRNRPPLVPGRSLPGDDHTSLWCDATGRPVAWIAQPYDLVEEKLEKMRAAARQYGFELVIDEEVWWHYPRVAHFVEWRL